MEDGAWHIRVKLRGESGKELLVSKGFKPVDAAAHEGHTWAVTEVFHSTKENLTCLRWAQENGGHTAFTQQLTPGTDRAGEYVWFCCREKRLSIVHSIYSHEVSNV